MGTVGTISIGPHGPVVSVLVGVSQAFASNAAARGRPIPVPVQADFLIDTGASVTVLDPALVARLSLVPRAGPLATTVTAGATISVNQYDVSLSLQDVRGTRPDLTLGNLLVAEIALGTSHYDGLLGRSVLQQCQLLYDGTAGTFRFDW